MSSKKKASLTTPPVAGPLTRSARKQLVRSVDSLIANFETTLPETREHVFDTSRPNALDRYYARLRDSAAALSRWHSDSRYMTEDGSLTALPKTGRISLTSLATETLVSPERAKTAVEDLIEFGLVRRLREKYIPDNRSAVVGERSPLVLAHATSAVSRLIDTVSHNVSGKRPSRFERQLSGSRISKKELPLFLRFVEQQGQYFIDSIDDWLATRAKPAGSDDGVDVGVGAFAWVEDPQPKTTGTTTPATRPRRAR